MFIVSDLCSSKSVPYGLAMADLSQASADGRRRDQRDLGQRDCRDRRRHHQRARVRGPAGRRIRSRASGASGPDGAGRARGTRAGDGAGAGPGPASSPEVLVIVCAGVVLASLDLFIVNVALPAIARDLGSRSLSDLSWVLNGYAIVYAALLVPAAGWPTGTGGRTGSCSASPSSPRRPRRAARRPASAC